MPDLPLGAGPAKLLPGPFAPLSVAAGNSERVCHGWGGGTVVARGAGHPHSVRSVNASSTLGHAAMAVRRRRQQQATELSPSRRQRSAGDTAYGNRPAPRLSFLAAIVCPLLDSKMRQKKNSQQARDTFSRGRPRKSIHIFHVCLRRLGPLTEIEDRRACDSDRRVTVNNIQVILVCCRPGDRGGCLGAEAQSAGPALRT